jgi:superfamily II DNA or RNA helicase
MRLFNKKQKQVLFIESKGKCCICKQELSRDWNADHVQPFSKGGETKLSNGQALCKLCNQKKSNKIMTNEITLRKWQQEFKYDFTRQDKTAYLLHAGVGSGKTIAAVSAVVDAIKNGWNIIIASPSENIKDGWAKEFLNFGYDIDNKYSFKYNYKKDFKGVSITYHSLNDNNVFFLLESGVLDQKTLLILDEVHHLGDWESGWGDKVALIGQECGKVLLLTGTPTRSDNAKIPFAEYEPFDGTKYKLKVDYSYSYKQSVQDKICCPITFRGMPVISEHSEDGFLSISDEHRSLLKEALTVENGWVEKMVNKADEELNDLRNMIPNAAGLVVCNSINDAKMLGKAFPDSVVITSDESNSDDIERFSKSDRKWIFTVRMVSEGVNIPRIRVIVYATNYSTPLFFQQVAGRGLRNRDDDALGTVDHCIFYYPMWEPLVNNAKEIENEIRHIVEEHEKEMREAYSRESYQLREEISSGAEFTLGEETIINGGADLTDVKDILESLPLAKRFRLERFLAEHSVITQPIHSQPVQLKREKDDEIRRKTNKQVAKYVALTGAAFKDVHYKLNNLIGITSSKAINDTELLMRKFNIIKKWNDDFSK